MLPPPRSTLFPYTTLFRSHDGDHAAVRDHAADDRGDADQDASDAGRDGEAAEPAVQLDGGDAAVSSRDDATPDRKSTRLNSSHRCISYAVFCLKKKKNI